jgi:hypothetical protein
MTEYIGRRITAGICKEATRGTTPGDPTIYWLRLLAQNHKDQVEYVDSQASLGTVVEFSDSEPNKEFGEGGAELELDYNSIPLLLYSLLGDIESDEIGATEVYEHTITIDEDAQRQSLSYFVDEPVSDKVFPLFCVGSLEFDFNLTDRPSVTVGAMSRKSAAGDSTPVFAEPNLFRPKDVKFYYADTVAGLGAGTEVKLKSLSLNFDTNMEADDVLGEGQPEDFLGKQLTTSASIEFLHRNETLKGFFRAGTPKAIRIVIENESIDFPGSEHPKIVFDFAKCYFKEWDEDNSRDDLKTQSFELSFAVDTQNETLPFGQVVVTNEIPSY